MSAHRTTSRRSALAVLAAALAAGALAAPAGARPVDMPRPHVDRQAVAAAPVVDRFAAPTSADSAYRDGFAGPASTTGAGPTPAAASGSDVPWLGIGFGILGTTLIAAGVVTLRRHRHHAPQRTPSFGA